MKISIVLAVLVASVVATVYEVYPTKYDNIDIDSVLNNKRLFDNYLQCLLKKGKCSEEGTLLRDVIPDALITGCRKCNERQKESVEKVIRFLVRERNDDWEELREVYDPRREYEAQYAQYLEKL